MPDKTVTTPKRAALAMSGIGLGSFVAAGISWQQNHSIMWALFHAIYSWFYVAYYFSVTNGAIPPLGWVNIGGMASIR